MTTDDFLKADNCLKGMQSIREVLQQGGNLVIRSSYDKDKELVVLGGSEAYRKIEQELENEVTRLKIQFEGL